MSERESLLGQIKGPRDLSNLQLSELTSLCAEIRRLIIETVAKNGGHLSSNLGVVELTLALHRVFDSPDDKIVWDVGHQCYAHKLLTGRFAKFGTLRQTGGIAGFPRRAESEHDVFDTGHASTSISIALGMLQAEKMTGGGGRCVAVIGDGALTGGLAYEALSNAGQLALPLVILLNDNRMSIGANVGGLSKHLSRLSMNENYQFFRVSFDSMIKKIPRIGKRLHKLVQRLKRAVKAVFYHDNFFVNLGFEYVGPIDGHNLAELTGVLRDVRKIERPVVVHVVTQKGKGYPFAEKDPGAFHSVPPFQSETGSVPKGAASWTHAFGQALLREARGNDKIIAVSAAMERGTGLAAFRKEFPGRFFDAGIAEAHAVSFSAALAVRGFRPVAAIYSTFIQRAVDSIIHDTAIGALPVVFAIDRAGLVGGDGETHQGIFDIAIFRAIPNMTVLAPASGSELALMLRYALSLPSPCAIRYPKDTLPDEDAIFSSPLVRGRGVLITAGGSAPLAPNLRFSATPPAGAAPATPPARKSAMPDINAEETACGGPQRPPLPTALSNPSDGGNRPWRPATPPLRETHVTRCIAFTGSLYSQVKRAAERLAENGTPCDLYNIRFLKPLDEDYLVSLLNNYQDFLVFEEGVSSGGIGEHIAAVCAQKKCRAAVRAFNTGDSFYAIGTREELLRVAGLDSASIVESVISMSNK